MDILLTAIILLVVPAILKALDKTKFVSIISPIALAYAAGIALSGLNPYLNEGLHKQFIEISIALSICLLVLSSSLRKFKVLLKPVLKSFLLGILSLFIAILLVFFFLAKDLPNSAEVMGMLTGVYVGGTPNLNAIGFSLGVSEETIGLVNTAEIVFGGIYFILLLTVIRPFLGLFLKKYTPGQVSSTEDHDNLMANKGSVVRGASLSILAAIVLLGCSFGLTLLLYGKMNEPLFLIILTTLSVIGAQTGLVRRISWKFETADFLLLVFSFGIGLNIDLNEMFRQGLDIYLLVGSVFIGTISIHYFFAWITGTDRDTLMISATAALYGPAFIPPVAKAIHNRELIVYGIALGLLGYVLGNFLGLMIAQLLNYL